MLHVRRPPVPRDDGGLATLVAELQRLVDEDGVRPEAILAEVHRIGAERGEDWTADVRRLEETFALPEPISATTQFGIAQEFLVRLLRLDPATRRFFVNLAHRSGAIHRNVIRLEQAPSQRRDYRAMGLPPGWEERLARAVAPWAVAPAAVGTAEGLPNAAIEQEIREFIASRNLKWPWLSHATIGAFTWFVDAVASAVLSATGDPYARDPTPRERLPLPADLPVLADWYWSVADRPALPEDRTFSPIVLFQGHTMEEARARVQAHVDEVERYLAVLERPAVPLGARPDKRRETIVRNVTWFYRNVVEREPILSLARAAFAAHETNSAIADTIAHERRKDVRAGIKSAQRLLDQPPYGQPILTLDEFEAGRTRI